MWWPTKPRQPHRAALSRRTVLVGLTTTVVSLPLAACGFKPMYAGGKSSPVTAQLGQVEVARINDRNGQVLRNALEQRLERSQNAGKKIYLLTVSLQESIDETGLSKDSFATRADMIISANFTLTYGKAQLLAGVSDGVVSYNILDQQYATVISEKDARTRAIEQVADDIQRRLSAYFSQHPSPPASPAPQ